MAAVGIFLVVTSGLLHAVWNLFAKRSRDKTAFLWWMQVVATLVYLPWAAPALLRGAIPADGWWLLVLAVLAHAVYVTLLSRTYAAGALLADTVRYMIATVLTFAMGYLMGYRPHGGFGHVVIAAVLVIASSWAISWIFAFFGVIARTASSVQGISVIVLFLLTFLSNAFVPVKTMPGWLQWFVNANPISHLVTAVRDLVNAGSIGGDFGIALIGAAVIAAIFAPLTVRAYMRRT